MHFQFHFLPVDHHEGVAHTAGEDTLHLLKDDFRDHFKKNHSIPARSGREAMSVLFEHLHLKKEDEIYITTTFDFPNVSACVTSTIFNYCKPSRVLGPFTKAIFVIHEFGVVHPEIYKLRIIADNSGIPLIEDCAHTFLSKDRSGGSVGTTGDWTIVSFPKFYPVSSGGMLLGNEPLLNKMTFDLSVLNDFAVVFQEFADNQKNATRRIEIARLFRSGINPKNIRFLLDEDDNLSVPWFFPVEVDQPGIYRDKLIKSGVETGLWYGSNLIVLPLHQYFTDDEVNEMIFIFNKVHLCLSDSNKNDEL
jgi:hypothetical protein